MMEKIDFSKIRLLTFDVVGTLIDFEAGIVTYCRSVAKEAGVNIPDEEILAAFGRAEGKQQLETPELPFTQMLSPVYEKMALEINLPTENKEAENFRESIMHWPAFPDSVDALKRLGARFRLVALTNADNWALTHMANTLDNPFDDTVTCEDVGVNKPDPQMFAYCSGRQSTHGIAKKQTLHVAQSQYHDIGVSMRLGYATCWIERRKGNDGFGATPEPGEVTRPNLHFATLRELADEIDKCLGDQ